MRAGPQFTLPEMNAKLRARALAVGGDLACVASLLGVALACLWPTLATFGQKLVGDLDKHPIDASWLYLLVSRMLLERFPPNTTSPWFNDPQPIDVLAEYADIGNPALAAILVRFLGPVLAYNTMQVFLATWSGVATFALGRVLRMSRPAALAGGVFAVVMEPLWFAIRWGEDDVATMGWLVAVIAVGFAVTDRLRLGVFAGGLLVGSAWGLVGWFNSYYLLFLGFALPMVLVADLRRPLRECALRAGGVALGLGLVWGPRVPLGFRSGRVGDFHDGANWIRSFSELTSPPADFPVSSCLDLVSLLWFDSEVRIAKAFNGQGEGCLYAGIGFCLLALVGLARGDIAGRRRLGALACFFGVMSLGPWLRDGDVLARLGEGGGIPMPAGLLGLVFSPLRRLDHAFRFVIVAFLVLAPLAGAGAAYIAGRVSRRVPVRGLLVVAMVVAASWERVIATPGAFPVKAASPPGARREYQDLRFARGAIFHAQWPLPGAPTVQLESNRMQRAMQVLVHQRPIVVDPSAAWLAGAVDRAAMEEVVAGLAALGVSRVVVHRNLDGDLLAYGRSPGGQRTPYAEQEKWATSNLVECLGSPQGRDVLIWLVPASGGCS